MTESNFAAMRAGAAASNDFAFALHARMGAEPGNTFYSPASLSLALAMTALGAHGETQAQLERVLGLGTVRETTLQKAYAALSNHLATANKSGDVELRTANRLWGQRGFDFLPPFLEATNRHYGASLEEVDFARNTEATRQHIHRWVSQQTGERIPERIGQGVLQEFTRLVLTNDASVLEKRVFKLTGREVAVSLPKFKLATTLQLQGVLSGLGMPLAFDPALADFSGMTARERLNLSAVLHQANLDVNEEGTEAAAATAMIAVAGAALEDEVLEFNADHPFLFFIRDTWSGAVLFQGKRVDPEA